MRLQRSGTRIEAAEDDARARTILVSDLHIGRDGLAVLKDFERLLNRAVERALETRVLVLGDLFEFYVGPGQLRLGEWGRVTSAIAGAVQAGVSVTVLHGNRDFMLGERFGRRTGCRVVSGGLSFRLAGRRALALHGDELCWRDRPYLRAKRILRNPCVRSLLACLPTAVGLRLGGQARQRSQVSQAPSVGRVEIQDRFEPVAEAIEEVFALGYELLVFGHIHRPSRGVFAGAEYCVLPAFDREAVFLEAEAEALDFRGLDGRLGPRYEARDFPSA